MAPEISEPDIIILLIKEAKLYNPEAPHYSGVGHSPQKTRAPDPFHLVNHSLTGDFIHSLGERGQSPPPHLLCPPEMCAVGASLGLRRGQKLMETTESEKHVLTHMSFGQGAGRFLGQEPRSGLQMHDFTGASKQVWKLVLLPRLRERRSPSLASGRARLRTTACLSAQSRVSSFHMDLDETARLQEGPRTSWALDLVLTRPWLDLKK